MSEHLTTDQFKRGQIEWALWQTFVFTQPQRNNPSAKFRTRIRRLLEVDRQQAANGSRRAQSVGRYGFLDNVPGQRGIDLSFSVFNVFCLAIGLDLLDMGFKQSECVFLLRHLRGHLQKQFDKILMHPPAPRQSIPAEERPGFPTYKRGILTLADCRVFVVITKVEFTEVYAAWQGKKKPLILEPVFCRGLAGLNQELERMNYEYRKALVLEIAELAVLVTDNLQRAPLIKRGRQ